MRKEGYYWVKLRGNWSIALWTTHYWAMYLIQNGYFDGYELFHNDKELQEIDENQITRAETIILGKTSLTKVKLTEEQKAERAEWDKIFKYDNTKVFTLYGREE